LPHSAAELFSGCASASVVSPVRPCFVAITHPHRSAPPQQCDPRVALAAAAAIAIAVTTVATSTKAPRSNGRSLQDSDIACITYHHRIAPPGNPISHVVALAAAAIIAITIARFAPPLPLPLWPPPGAMQQRTQPMG